MSHEAAEFEQLAAAGDDPPGAVPRETASLSIEDRVLVRNFARAMRMSQRFRNQGLGSRVQDLVDTPCIYRP